jgi:hypothetical protein
MGAWDASLFANDDAADISFEFDDASTTAEVARIIESALETALNSTPDLEAPMVREGWQPLHSLSPGANRKCSGRTPPMLRNLGHERPIPCPDI